MKQFLNYCCIILLGLSSCKTTFKDEKLIFHGSPESSGIGSLSFGLYRNHKYLIINSGGIGSSEYSGPYTLNSDTIIFHNLDKDVPLKSNRLIIYRYNQQDSTYWEWKYSRLYESLSNDRKLGPWLWEDYRSANSGLGEGDIYQLGTNNLPIKNEYHFIISLDSLSDYKN